MVVPYVAYILSLCTELNNSRLPYVYAFEFHAHARKAIELVMMGLKLPDHVEWYSTDGLNLFAMRGASGGVVTNYICYLVTKIRWNVNQVEPRTAKGSLD